MAHLAVGLDTGEFARALSQTQKRLLLWTAIVALLSVGLILLFTSRITRPLAALLEGAWRISRGQIGYQIKSKAPGELGELLETFNRMSRDLQESIERLKNLHSQMVRAEKFYTLGQFAAGVAHEIRNPLTSITLALEFLKNNPQNPKAFEIIEKEIRHIDHLIQTFLDFARSHSLQLRHEEVQLNTLVAETLDLIKFQARKQGVKLESSLPPLPPLKSSPEALRQILLNLTLNALQAMPEGGLLRVETRQASEKVELIVEDTGPGIPEEVLSHIFEPFFTTKPQGTGLGLTITRNLVEILGGEIRVFSTPGKGTRFVVTLPLKAPEITDPSTGSRSQDYLFSGERNSRKTTSA